MNAPIRRLGLVLAAMFCALLVAATTIQFVQAQSLNDKPGNRRTLLATYGKQRGSILVDGKAVAESVPVEDDYKYLRSYPQGKLYASVTGYYSIVYGASGIENSYNDLLSGSSDKLFYRRIVDMVTGQSQKGASVELTINPKAQQVAADAMGSQRGAVVALDPRSGAILAMYSSPTYNPNSLASHDLSSVIKTWQQLTTEKSNPMLNRSINELYPPGSTFKLITSAAALSTGKYNTQSELNGAARLPLPGTSISLPNDNGQACGADNKTTLQHALTISCNTAFGSLGMDLGQDALRDQASKFGFAQPVTVPMSVTPSVYPTGMDKAQTAMSAIGQFDVRATPLQMAMVAAGIANDGKVMTPYLGQTVRDANLNVIQSADPKLFSTAVTPQVANDLTTMMVSVVDEGTGKKARIDGVKVAGKTGTAETAPNKNADVWFVGFAPADNPTVAVAVLVEDGGTAGQEALGGTVAAPIAKQVMEAVLQQ